MSDSLKKAIEVMKSFKISPKSSPEVQEDAPGVSKALTTNSFPILKPRPDGTGIEVSTRAFSAFKDPFNGMVLSGELIQDHNEYKTPLAFQETRKSCESHGRSYAISKSCYDCDILKASICKGCGSDMYKAPGGGTKCYSCEDKE